MKVNESYIVTETAKVANSEFYRLVQEELIENGKVCFTGYGSSMYPQIRGGRDEILLRKFNTETDELHVGDICLFSKDGRYVIHRIIRKLDKNILLQGDNNIAQVECCQKGDIIGIVEEIHRNGKTIRPNSLFWKIRRQVHRMRMKLTGFAARAYTHFKRKRN